MEYKAGDKVIIANNLKEIDKRIRETGRWTPKVVPEMIELEGKEFVILNVSCDTPETPAYFLEGSIYSWIEEYFISYVQPEVASDDDINLLIGG